MMTSIPGHKKNYKVKEYLKDLENDPEFIANGIVLDLLEGFLEIMEKGNVLKSELASRLGESEAWVDEFFGGDARTTILDVVRVAKALNVKFPPARRVLAAFVGYGL